MPNRKNVFWKAKDFWPFCLRVSLVWSDRMFPWFSCHIETIKLPIQRMDAYPWAVIQWVSAAITSSRKPVLRRKLPNLLQVSQAPSSSSSSRRRSITLDDVSIHPIGTCDTPSLGGVFHYNLKALCEEGLFCFPFPLFRFHTQWGLHPTVLNCR